MTDDISPRTDENGVPWCSDWECYKHQPNPPQPHCYNAYSVCSELEDRPYGDPPICPVAVRDMAAELNELRCSIGRAIAAFETLAHSGPGTPSGIQTWEAARIHARRHADAARGIAILERSSGE